MNYKRLTAVLLVVGMLALLPLLGACGEKEPQEQENTEVKTDWKPEEKIELTYVDHFPPTHVHSLLAAAWQDEITKRTNGRVTFVFYPGGSLGGATKIYDTVVEGIADVGTSCCSYTMGRFPVFELFDVPHGYPDGWVATMVVNDFYNEFKPVEFNETHVLYFHAHGPGMLHTTEKPVRTLEDMKGLVIRATGVGANVAAKLGGSGYAAGQDMTYELAAKGVVDGSLSPIEVMKGYEQADVFNYSTNCDCVGYSAAFYVVMNKKKWDALPTDIQEIFTEVSEEWIEKCGMAWKGIDVEGREYFLSLGGEVIELSAEESARWVAATDPLVDEYMERQLLRGLDATDNEKYLNERISYWTGKGPSIEECLDYVIEVQKALPPDMPKLR